MKYPRLFLASILIIVNGSVIGSYLMGRIDAKQPVLTNCTYGDEPNDFQLDIVETPPIDMNEPADLSVGYRGKVGMYYPATEQMDITDANCLTDESIERIAAWAAKRKAGK